MAMFQGVPKTVTTLTTASTSPQMMAAITVGATMDKSRVLSMTALVSILSIWFINILLHKTIKSQDKDQA